MDYLKLLEHSYEQCKEDQSDGNMGGLEFLADQIFDFTTYENIVSSLMAKKCLEVCQAISLRQTFDYIHHSDENNQWYLIMVNMPFIADRIDWGTSIRGAFWTCPIIKIHSCGLYVGYEQLFDLSFNGKQWNEFIDAMIAFSQVSDGEVS